MNEFSVKVLTSKVGETYIFSLGQAGYVIKSASGQLLAVDPYLSECVERAEGHVGFKRLLPKILMPFDLEFDFLITTHPHLDHFDMDSVPQLMSNQKTKLFASVDCKQEVERLLMSEERVEYVKPGDSVNAGDFALHFVNCDHGAGAPDAVGVVISVDGKLIYMAGDTCLRLDRTQEYLQFGAIDVLIAPINGAYGNLDETECVELAKALQPKLTIPSHYGMFASHGGNPGKFFDVMKNTCPELHFCLMCQGEGIVI